MGAYLGSNAVDFLGGITTLAAWEKIATKEFTVSTTSTTASSVGTIATSSALWDKDLLIYVKIRDKAGKQNSTFYGTDNIFVNYNAKNGNSTTIANLARSTLRVGSAGSYTNYAGAYGVYAYSLGADGTIAIYKRYNSSYSFTINSTYVCEVYTLKCPFTILE